MKELKDRTLEVAICIEAVIILVLICLVLHLMLQCPYDVNKDLPIDRRMYWRLMPVYGFANHRGWGKRCVLYNRLFQK